MSGTLFVIATPIGNMDDITYRAVSILKTCDYILAEDSRVSKSLLQRLGINTKICSYHKFTEKKLLHTYIDEIKRGKNIGLISDAGTPCISDPGKYLVNIALENNLKIVPVPGPSAVSAAFSCSGSMFDSFVFAGFLPSKGIARENELNKFLSFNLPVVFYEAPSRIKDLIQRLNRLNTRIVILRELTKMYEEIFLYDGREIKEKGEFTVIAELNQNIDKTTTVDEQLIDILRQTSLSNKDLTTLVSRIYPEIPKNEIKKIWF